MSSVRVQMPSLTVGEVAVVQQLQQDEVLTLQDIMARASVSHVTVFSGLGKWGYHRSYNQNGRYYTLKETPRFNERGLWRWDVAHFSVCGSLTKTLASWVCGSDMGLTAKWLGTELGANVQSSLRELTGRGVLLRERIGRQFVYFGGERSVADRQREKFLAAWRCRRREVAIAGLPDKDTIIEILLQLIERPRSALVNVRRRMARAGYTIRLSDVQAVFEHYELDKKRAL